MNSNKRACKSRLGRQCLADHTFPLASHPTLLLWRFPCQTCHALPEEPSVTPQCWWDEIQTCFSTLLSLVSFSVWPLPSSHILEPAPQICHFLSYTFNFPISRHFYVSWLQKALVTNCKYHCSHPALTIPSRDPPTPWQSPRLLSSELLIHASVLPGA